MMYHDKSSSSSDSMLDANMHSNNPNLIHGFELINEQPIEEIKGRAYIYRHKKSGAELIALQNQDPNKLFSISFRTRSDDSSGLFHILEHCALAGSLNYPLKEPFATLMKGSLYTFLNAYTLNDATVYPIASTNDQDFKNLSRIYLDAVFFPLLSRRTFEQEGWHLHLKSAEQPLTYEGVVHSEMKGSFGDPDLVISLHSMNSLFPDSAYRFTSWGIPRDIPTLTYERFRAAHSKFYHPSNAKIVIYGNCDINENLKLAAEYLDQFDATEVDSKFLPQPRFDAPRSETHRFDPGKSELTGADGAVTVNWLLPEGRSVEKRIAWEVLSAILVESSASPLYNALVRSGLGDEPTASDFIGDGLTNIFTTGLSGIDTGDATKVEELILKELRSLVDNRLNPELIQAALDSVEFKLREDDPGSEPKGLVYLFRMMPNLIHGGDAVSLLSWKEPLTRLRARVASGEAVFEKMIEEELLNNPHRTRVTFEPVVGLQQIEEQEERERLLEIQKGLSAAELREIVSATWELERLQSSHDSPEALALIKTVDRSTLKTQQDLLVPHITRADKIQYLHSEVESNGITYLNLMFEAANLSRDELKLMPFLARVITELGTDKFDAVQFTNRVQIATGGGEIKAGVAALGSRDISSSGRVVFTLSGSALDEKNSGLVTVLSELISEVDFDNAERLMELVLECRSAAEGTALESTSELVISRLRSRHSAAGAITDLFVGAEQVKFLRELEKRFEADCSSVIADLKSLRNKLISSDGLIVHGSMPKRAWDELRKNLEPLITALPTKQPLENKNLGAQHHSPSPISGLILPGKISYCGMALKLSHNDSSVGSLLVLTELLSNGYLWEEVRVKGKAYGASAKYDPIDNLMVYSSWRDPNPQNTLKVFADVPEAILKGISDDDLNRAIIATIRELDTPKTPKVAGSEALVFHLCGVTPELRQLWREQVLATTQKDLIDLAKELKLAADSAVTVVAGPEELLNPVRTTHGDSLTSGRIV